RPVVSPNEVLRLLGARVHQKQSALKIIQQLAVSQVRRLAQQPLVEPVGLVGVAPGVEENERLPHLDMVGLLEAKLPDHHDAAENQEQQEKEGESILTQETHSQACNGGSGDGATGIGGIG